MPPSSAVPRAIPRLTARVFTDLAVWMIGLGLLIGLVFPFAIIPLGVPAEHTLRPRFFAATLAAGLIVGAANFALARGVVGAGLRWLAQRMRYVSDVIGEATYTGDWSRCSPETCALQVDADDELGRAAESFNHLLHALHGSRRIQHAMAGYARTLTSHLEIEALCAAALDGLLEHSGADAGALCILRDGELRLEASRLLETTGLLDSSMVLEGLQASAVTLVEVGEDVSIDAAVVRFRPAAVAVVPIHVKDVPIGAVVLAFSHVPTPEQLRLLESLRRPTGVALENALTHERFQRLAAIDPLTGVYNRRFGLGRLQEEFSRAVRSGSPLGLLAFDLDHFKQVNDTHGHLVGDQVLREVAGVARVSLREGDVLVRSGGEEFLVVLPGAGPDDVRAIGERLRRAVAELDVAVLGTRLSLTVSLGGLAFPDTPGNSLEELVECTDRALYSSKGQGRDQLTMCGQDGTVRPVPA